MRSHVVNGVFGTILGAGLSCMGFADWGEVHRMFTFADLRLFLTFAVGVTLTGIGLLVVARGRTLPPRPIHRGSVVGGLLFGAGWAITGACPGAALVQIGEGQLAALVTFAAMLAGTLAYRVVHARWFRWDRGSCET